MTDIEDIQKLMDNYWQWMRDRTVLKNVSSGWCEISTPFLDRHNDGLQIYVKKDGDNFLLSDDGYTIGDLKLGGYNINTDKRKGLLERLLDINGVELNGNELKVLTSPSDFPSRKNDLLNAMTQINDLYVTSRSNVMSLFLDDVGNWLDEKNLYPARNVKIKGISHVDFSVDFLFPPTKIKKERALQAINKPSLDTFSRAALLVKEFSNRKTEIHLMMNDENSSTTTMNKIYSIAKTNGVAIHTWSNKEEAVDILS